MRTRRPHSPNFRGLLVIGLGAVVAASACNDNASTGIDDPALRGATVGEVEALVSDFPDGTSEREQYINVAGVDGARLRLRFLGEPAPQLTSGDRIGVWGDRLGDEFVVTRHIVMPADETSVTSALIGAPAKPQTAVFVVVDVGGGSNVTNAMATSSVFSPGNNFASVYDKLSFGIMKMTGDVQGPFSYPMTSCDYSGLVKAVKPMVQGTYNHYMWYFGSKVSSCAWSGIGSEGYVTRPQSDAWYNASTGCTVLVQEVGHNEGWMHSSTLACTGATFDNDPATNCKSSEYGNRMTPMGSGCGMLNAHDLWYHQLIGGCNGVKVTTSGTFNLFPLENACNGIQAIQIPMITTGRMAKPEQGNNQPLKNYYLEYRTKTGLDASITSAVYVYAGDDIHAPSKTSNWSWLLDMNPSTTTFDGLTANGTFSDPNGNIKVTVMSADTTKAVVQIDIMGGAGAAPTCIDNSTVEAPGPVDCGSGPATGTGGAGGATGTGGAGGAGGAGGMTTTGTGGRGGTTGSAGRGGTTGTGGVSTTGNGGRGGTTGTGGSIGPGTGGSIGTGRGGTTGSAGNGGAGGATGSGGSPAGVAGSIGSGVAGSSGNGTGNGGMNGTPTGTAGNGIPTGAAGTSGKAGSTGQDGQVTGGCSCAIDPRNEHAGWGALGLLGVGMVVRRRQRRG